MGTLNPTPVLAKSEGKTPLTPKLFKSRAKSVHLEMREAYLVQAQARERRAVGRHTLIKRYAAVGSGWRVLQQVQWMLYSLQCRWLSKLIRDRWQNLVRQSDENDFLQLYTFIKLVGGFGSDTYRSYSLLFFEPCRHAGRDTKHSTVWSYQVYKGICCDWSDWLRQDKNTYNMDSWEAVQHCAHQNPWFPQQVQRWLEQKKRRRMRGQWQRWQEGASRTN